MARFSYINPGAAAVDALMEELARREIRRQQEFVNSITSRNMALDEQREGRIKTHQDAQLADLALQRESQMVDRMHEDAMPGDVFSGNAADLMQKHRPGALRSSGAGIDAEARLETPNVAPDEVGTVDDIASTQTRSSVVPGVMFHRGGTKFLAEQKERDDKAAAALAVAQANNQARADKAEADRLSREQITADRMESQRTAREDRQFNAIEERKARVARQRADQFDRNPIVRRMNIVSEGYDFVRSLPDTAVGQTSADAQALIYAYAKAMDPESVVREGEYATVQGYAQSRLKALGQNIERWYTSDGFISDEGVKAMKQAIGDKYRASRVSYNNLKKETARKINKETGDNDGESYLTNYDSVYPDAPAPRNPNATPANIAAAGSPASASSGPVVVWEKGPDGKPRRKVQ